MRIVVDYELCEGNARCEAIAPEVFQVGDDDVLRVLVERPDEAMREAVARACERCPRGALSIEE